jgi:hypothetical protein
VARTAVGCCVEGLTAYIKEHHCGGISYVVNLWSM